EVGGGIMCLYLSLNERAVPPKHKSRPNRAINNFVFITFNGFYKVRKKHRHIPLQTSPITENKSTLNS
ncbi:hypothetical protein, partial [Phocaeicola plebeius]|uniref:hypothetical protein n=1 Tax=Phocaeicola plebeius TaxID=310297 RepID=UPI0026EB3198